MKYKLYVDGGSGANLSTPQESKDEPSPFPSIVLKNELFKNNENRDDLIGEGELPLSMVVSAGESKPYTLYFFEGNEPRWFFKERKYIFEVLFNQMTTRPEPHWSRLMKRVVLVNNNGPLFEMMDGRLYLFEIGTGLLSPFFIETITRIRTIGSGLMSNVIMVQTVDGKIIKKHFNDPPKEITINDPSPVKLFSCYCRDLQIIVLENNKFFIVKAGSIQDSHYGFTSYPLEEAVEVVTPFKNGIKKVASGYGHCVILLENGQVYSRGLNNYHQCATEEATDTENQFFEISSVIGAPVTDIECGSICSAFRTKTEFVFVGSLYSNFFKGYRHKIEYEDQQMSVGPWHGLIFRNKYQQRGKSEIYFFNNLKLSVQHAPFSDTLFHIE